MTHFNRIVNVMIYGVFSMTSYGHLTSSVIMGHVTIRLSI